MELHKKRKVDSERRAFNKDWMPTYFFTEIDNERVCLLCNQSVAVLKEYNISRHYATEHGKYGKNLSEPERQTRAAELDRKLARLQNMLVKSTLAQKSSTHASVVVAYHIAKHNKPFSDGEFIKKCMLDVADQICPEKRQKFEEVSLMRRTLARRIEINLENLTSQLKGIVPSFQLFSLDLKTEILLFSEIKGKDKEVPQLKQSEWLSDLAFAIDLFEHLNELNTKLQGKGTFAHKMYSIVKAFRVKLKLFSRQLSQNITTHFGTPATMAQPTIPTDKHTNIISALDNEFGSRFADLTPKTC